MTEHAFDALTRSLGRRRAVQALAATAATTLSGVTQVGARSNNGKNKKKTQKIKKQAIALCVDQISQCEVLVGDNPAGITCCQLLGDCDFTGFIACLRGI